MGVKTKAFDDQCLMHLVGSWGPCGSLLSPPLASDRGPLIPENVVVRFSAGSHLLTHKPLHVQLPYRMRKAGTSHPTGPHRKIRFMYLGTSLPLSGHHDLSSDDRFDRIILKIMYVVIVPVLHKYSVYLRILGAEYLEYLILLTLRVQLLTHNLPYTRSEPLNPVPF